MERRIYGVETEYGITCASTTGKAAPLEAEESARELFAPLTKRGRSTNLFLANGGRLYLDVGAHPEYATAECDNLWDLLAQDRAGAVLLARMAAEANDALEKREFPGRIHLFRNNFDSAGNSFGCHENYLLRRKRDFREVADALVAHFVTRQVIVGAGAVKEKEDGRFGYCFAARSDQMWDAVSAATTRSRPIINTRDEPLADASAYRRLHVIVGDTNMAEPTTALKVGATELLLNAVDRGVQIDDLALAAPLEAIRAISWDLSGQLLLETADGRHMRAVDIQQTLIDRIMSVIGPDELSDLQKYLIGLWQRALDAVADQNWKPIEMEIDFAIKKKLIDGYRDRGGADLNDPRVSRLLLSYHEITTTGLRNRLEETGLMKRLTDQGQVQGATQDPPQTTRAALRGRAIRAAEECYRDLNVDWVHLRLDGSEPRTIALRDPFATVDQQVDDLVGAIVASSPRFPA